MLRQVVKEVENKDISPTSFLIVTKMYLSTGDQLSKLWLIHTMKHYATIKE